MNHTARLTTALAALVLVATPGLYAEIVETVDLTLTSPDGSTNQLEIQVDVMVSAMGDASGSDVLDLTGNMQIDLYADIDPTTYEAAILGFTFREGTRVHWSDATIAIDLGPLGNLVISGDDLQSRFETLYFPYSIVDPVTEEFGAYEHMAVLDNGTFGATGGMFAGESFNFTTDPEDLDWDWDRTTNLPEREIGTASVVLRGVAGTKAVYDVGLVLPYDFLEAEAVAEEGVIIDISGSATFEGHGQLVRTLPGLTWVGPDFGEWSSPEGWDGDPADVPNVDVRTYVPAKIVALNADGATASLLIDGVDAGLVIAADSTLTVARNLQVAQGSLHIAATGTLETEESISLDEGSRLTIEVAGTSAGEIFAGDTVALDTGGSLHFTVNGLDPFKAGQYDLIEVDPGAEDGFSGSFGTVDGLGEYAKSGDGNGLGGYNGKTLTLTIDRDLNMGDANLDLTTDVRDFNKWNAAKFTTGTDWTSGDFDNNGITDVRDFNKWNAYKFTTAPDPNALVEGQVPEPGALALLACAALGLLLARRRRA